MKKFLFIGINFSKSKFDASLLKSMSNQEVASGKLCIRIIFPLSTLPDNLYVIAV